MAVDIGPKIGIDGEAAFRRSIQEISQSLKTMDAEGKALAATMNDEADAEKKNAAQKELLARQIQAQRAGLEQLKKGLEDSTAAYGANDVKTQKWQKAVYDATADLAKMEHELDSTGGEVDELGDEMQETEQDTKSWADVLKGNLLSDVIKSGFNMLKNAVKEAGQAIKEAFTNAAAFADEMNTLSMETGLATETLQEYKYMEDLLDVSLDTISGSLTKLTKNMQSARKGTGEAADAFADLGVEVTDSNGDLRKAEDVFNDVIDALGKVENETERDAKAMTIFGKSAKELNPLIKKGSEELNKLKQAAHDSGYVLSGQSLEALQSSKDAMDSLEKAAEAVKNQFSVGLAPGVSEAAKTMEDALTNPRTQEGIRLLGEGLGDIASFLADLAADVLPVFLSVFGIFDARLLTYTDDELALSQAIRDQSQAWQELTDTYNTEAQGIINEKQRVTDLWEELQNLTDETGNVKDADIDRAKFITGELAEALDKEITWTGNQITNYQDLEKEIKNLIDLRTAEALMAAGNAAYTTALQDQEQAAKNLLDATNNLTAAKSDLAEAQQKLDDYVEKYGELEGAVGYGMLTSSVELCTQKVASMSEEYQNAYDAAASGAKTISAYHAAEAAMLEGNYELAIRLMTSEMNFTMTKYQLGQQLEEEDLQNLRDSIAEKEALIKQQWEIYAQEGTEATKEEIAAYTESLHQMKEALAAGLQEQIAEISAAEEEKKAIYESYKADVEAGVVGTNNLQLELYAMEVEACRTAKEEKLAELQELEREISVQNGTAAEEYKNRLDEEVDATEHSYAARKRAVDTYYAGAKNKGKQLAEYEAQFNRERASQTESTYSKMTGSIENHVKKAKSAFSSVSDASGTSNGTQLTQLQTTLGKMETELEKYKTEVVKIWDSMTAEQLEEIKGLRTDTGKIYTEMIDDAKTGGYTVGEAFANGILEGTNGVGLIDKIDQMIKDIIASAAQQASNGTGNSSGGSSGGHPGGGGNTDVPKMYNPFTTTGLGAIGGTASYQTVRIDRIELRVDGSRAENVDQLADLVARKINDQIIYKRYARIY